MRFASVPLLLLVSVCGGCVAHRPASSPEKAVQRLDLPMPVEGVSAERLTGGAAETAWAGCEDVRIHPIPDSGIVASMWECLAGGDRRSLRWTFRGVLDDPTSLPRLSAVVRLPRHPMTTWASDPQPSDGYVLRRGPDALREIVWDVDGVRFAALVHAITDRPADRSGPSVKGALAQYRVAWLEVGPKVHPRLDPKKQTYFVESVVGKPAPPPAPCVAEGDLRLTIVCTETKSEAGIVTFAEWRFLGPAGPMAPAPLRVIRDVPKEAFLIEAREPWKRETVEGFGKRLVRWQQDGIDWTVELESQPVLALKVATSYFAWRESRSTEWRVRRVTQIPIEAASPLPTDAPRVSFAGAVELFRDTGNNEPKPKKRDAPAYPMRARAWEIESTVVLGLVVDEKGRADEIVLLQGAPMLDRAAIAAVMHWQYEPFVRDGGPISWHADITLRFQLR